MILLSIAVPVGAQIDVRVKTITDEFVSGRLKSLDAKHGITLEAADQKTVRIAMADIVRITAGTLSTLARPGRFTVTLGQGDVLHGMLGEGTAESLLIETSDIGPVTLPLDLVVRIDAARAAEATFRDSVEWLDRTTSTDEDRILLTNGDVVRGFIINVGVDGISIEGTLGETLIPAATIVAARFASSTVAPPKPPYQIVSFQSSGRLSVRKLIWTDDVVKAVLPSGGEMTIQAERIAIVELFGGKWEWLSHHVPISYQHTPMLTMGWGYVRDRNVLGKPLTVAGRTFTHGIGVHSRASLTFDLKDQYREFVTAYGIDDDSGPHADVSVSILIDGRPRHDVKHVRRGKLHPTIRLDVTGAKRIELIVDFGDNGDIQDRFNWIESALIR